MHHPPAHGRLAPLVVALALLSACSAAPASGNGWYPPGYSPPGFEDLVSAALADAEVVGADPSQVEVLERAAAAGHVDAEDFIAARRAALDCMAGAGLQISDVRTTESRGVSSLDATIAPAEGMSDDSMLAIADACDLRYSKMIEGVYFQQSSTLEAYYQQAESHRSEVITCLAGWGITVAPDAPLYELFFANDELVEREFERNIVTPRISSNYDCMLETGAYDG